MKEKIGKLLELLNEYHHFNSDLIYYGWDEEYERVYFHTELPEEEKKKLAKAGIDDEGIDEQRVYDEWICSKKFGFIKWLVENDKIDIKALVVKGEMRSGWDFDNKKGNEESGEDVWNKYYSELCLMLLSISSSPIEDLISYLK